MSTATLDVPATLTLLDEVAAIAPDLHPWSVQPTLGTVHLSLGDDVGCTLDRVADGIAMYAWTKGLSGPLHDNNVSVGLRVGTVATLPEAIEVARSLPARRHDIAREKLLAALAAMTPARSWEDEHDETISPGWYAISRLSSYGTDIGRRMSDALHKAIDARDIGAVEAVIAEARDRLAACDRHDDLRDGVVMRAAHP
jgi:hypothetical protein